MKIELERIIDRAEELKKVATPLEVELLKLIQALTIQLSSESTVRMFSGASGHGY
jgi:hypothetical protein